MSKQATLWGGVGLGGITVVSIVALWSSFSIIAALFLATMLIGVVGYGIIHIQNKRDFLHVDEHSIVFRNELGHVTIYDKVQRMIAPSSIRVQEEKFVPFKIEAPKETDKDVAILGVDATGQQVSRPWKRLKNILVLGLSGGGKSNTLAWLALQTLKAGGKIALIDKHSRALDESLYGKLKPVESHFIMPVGGTPETALAVIDRVRTLLDERLNGAEIEPTILFMIDELTATLNKASDASSPWHPVAVKLGPLLEDLNVEGRKVGMRVIAAGQTSNASRTAGTEVRELFNTRIYHAMRQRQAIIVGMSEFKKDIQQQGVGKIMVDTEGESPYQIQVPRVTDEDLEAVGVIENVPVKQIETKVEEVVGTNSKPPLPLVTENILRRYKNGMEVMDIVKEIWPDATSPTAKAEKKLFVQTTLREQIGGLLNGEV